MAYIFQKDYFSFVAKPIPKYILFLWPFKSVLPIGDALELFLLEVIENERKIYSCVKGWA